MNTNTTEYDVFISHAWEDKAEFVRPLAEQLISLGLKVWYDELSLELGDSLSANIDRGLATSAYGVVVLSPSFFAKHWPERELAGLVQRANQEGRKVVLPIWHNVDQRMVASYSPPLADLLAATSTEGVEDIAARILGVVSRSQKRDHSGRPERRPPGRNGRDVQAAYEASRGRDVSEIPIHKERGEYSRQRLDELKGRFKGLPELSEFATLTIFSAGSFGRMEASEFSDIDLFFVRKGGASDLDEPRTKELRLFGRMIGIIDELNFPKFSNDCQYLQILHSDDIVKHLGSPNDDYQNFFTARMLMLLESKCLYGEEVYDEILSALIGAYFRDYPDHRHTFQPVFLLNDICRYWKTILLNYEHKRNLPPAVDQEEAKRKQKVRNFKLKYSRMTTCFATIGALGSHMAPVTEEQVLDLARKTPRERLESIASRLPSADEAVQDVLSRYRWFLEMTGLPMVDLEDHFSDKQKRIEMFQEANEFGDSMYRLLETLDATNEKLDLLRYLVI